MKNRKFEINTISKYRSELMGLAILGVMCGHFMNHTYQNNLLFSIARIIHTPGFLFLSGFGLYYSFVNNSNLGSFYLKRLKRLYFPFLLISTPFFFALLLLNKCNFLQFLGYITTAAYWVEGNYYAMWYIAISLFLYILFPFFFRFIFNRLEKPLMFTIFLLILLSLGMLFIRTVNPLYYKIIEFGITKMYIFPLGIFCGYLSFNKIAIPYVKLFTFIMLCIVLYLLGINQAVTRTLVGIPIVCLCIDCVFKDRNNKILVCMSWLGKYSLELYLLHVLIYFTFWQIIGLNDAVSMFIGIILSMLLCSPISSLVKKLV